LPAGRSFLDRGAFAQDSYKQYSIETEHKKLVRVIPAHLQCSKNVGFRNTVHSVPLMYGLMSFETLKSVSSGRIGS
jgi:hypothetical protein